MLAENYGVFVVCERFNGIDFFHDLLVSSFLGETFLQFFLGLTFELHSLCNLRCHFLFGSSNCCYVVSIGIGNDFSSFGTSLLDNLSLDKLCFRSDLIILKVSLSINLLNSGNSLCFPLLLDLIGFCLNLFNFQRLLHLLELSRLLNIFSLFFFDLFLTNFFFVIILNSLVIGELLSLQGVLELIDGSFLHGLGDVGGKNDICNNDSLHMDSLIAQVSVKMLKHTTGVLLTTKGVGLVSFNRSSHSSDSFLDIGIDKFIDLTNVGGQLLDVVFLLGELHEKGETDGHVGVIKGENLVVGALIDEILHGDKILSFCPWQTPKKSSFLIIDERTTTV